MKRGSRRRRQTPGHPRSHAPQLTRVLVLGFEPWGKHRTNPSGELAREFGGVVLPTEYRACERALVQAVRERRPRAVLMLGLAQNRRAITPEVLAVNADHASIPDNAGEKRRDRRIDPRGPAAIETRLPVRRFLAALKRARVPTALSFHAGTFCCNHVFYTALRRLRIPAGFVHVPTFRTMPRDVQRRAVAAMLRVLGAGRA